MSRFWTTVAPLVYLLVNLDSEGHHVQSVLCTYNAAMVWNRYYVNMSENEVTEQEHFDSLASRLSMEARAFMYSSIGSSLHERSIPNYYV